MAGKTAKAEISTETRRRHIDHWKSSGLAKDKYCEKSGVTINQLTYWQKILGSKRSTTVQKSRCFSRVAVTSTSTASTPPAASLRIVVGSAFVEISESANPIWAARVIAAIGGNA